MKSFITLLKDSFTAWSHEKTAVWAAALSYYTLFSLAPLLLIIISITGLVLGREAIEGSLYKQIDQLVGRQGALMIQQMIRSTSQQSTNIFSSIVGFIILAIGASGVFGQLKEALNTIFRVQPRSNAGMVKTVRDRFLSFSMIIVIGFLLLVSLATSAIISAANHSFSTLLPVPGIVIETANIIVSLIIITIMFTIMFTILPDVIIPSRIAWRGALLTAILFTIGKTLLGIYIGQSSLTSTYAAAASLAIILVWVYYASQILFFGAEFTKIYAQQQNVMLQPKPGAMRTKEEELEKLKLARHRIASSFLAGMFTTIAKDETKGERVKGEGSRRKKK